MRPFDLVKVQMAEAVLRSGEESFALLLHQYGECNSGAASKSALL